MNKKTEARNQIEAFIENTLKDYELKSSDILEENCPFCNTAIVVCPRCNKKTPIGLYCQNCKQPISLESLTEQIASRTAKSL